MPVLEVQNVAKSYRLPGQKTIPVLEDVSLSVELGEHVAIVGRSGAFELPKKSSFIWCFVRMPHLVSSIAATLPPAKKYFR